MNSLSWFIYLTQIVDNVGGASAVFFGILLIVGGTVGSTAFFVFFDDIPSEFPIRSVVRWWVVALTISGVLAAFVPSRRTMLMIAGSEMGERLVKSDGVNSIVNPGMDLIRKWIKQEADKIKDKS
jgi:hypothetical protein